MIKKKQLQLNINTSTPKNCSLLSSVYATEKQQSQLTVLKPIQQLVLSNLFEDDRRDFNTLIASLTSRFGVTHPSELARAKLKTRFRRKDKNLPEIVTTIKSLTRRLTLKPFLNFKMFW